MARVLRGLLADPALPLRDARVLDFGCGTRPYEAWFAAAGARYRGADIDAAHEVRIRDDGTLDCADGEYDLVASFQVLEHVWDLGAYLGEARRALQPEGWLLLSTHGSWLYHPHPHDYRRWTAEGLQREVESRGFRLVRMEPVVGPLAWTTIFRSLGVAHVLKPLALVVLVGYWLHSSWTFPGAERGGMSFARYTLTMALNLPLLLAGMFVFVDLAGLGVPIAAPAVTVLVAAFNFVGSRWALRAGRA